MRRSARTVRQQLSKFQSLLVLVLMIVAMTALSERFLTAENGWIILRQISFNICLSIGMTMVIISGGIDLSVGSILALSGAITAGLIKNPLPIPWLGVQLEFTVHGAICAGLLVGMFLGWFNGQMITKVRIPPFVATLGMLSIARGLTMLWTKGFPITGLGPQFAVIGTATALGVPVPVWISLGLVVVFVVVTKKTRFGRYIYAIGGNERTAQLSGLKVDRIKVAIYTLAGGLSAVAGLIVASRLDSAQPNAGMGYELDVIAAVVIGGTSLMGGRGGVWGTLVGALLIGTINNGMNLLMISSYYQLVVKGGIIVAAVLLDRLRDD